VKSPHGAFPSAAPPEAPEEPVVPGGFSACGLDGRPQNAGQARKFAAHTLDAWALQSLAGDVELIVSELVGNAVRHALGPAGAATAPAGPTDDDPVPGPDQYPVWLGLFRYARHLVCAVTDPSPAPPRLCDPAASAVGGRGLFLISSLSDTWSWQPTPPRGKTVWASLPLPSPRAS
jgi:anti-sigma regulatory factor (Ser/Thr protein kinase)